ncbi:MAG: hypothetical protein ACL93V_07665 [Candidatus Electrothrix sp. YB6]
MKMYVYVPVFFVLFLASSVGAANFPLQTSLGTEVGNGWHMQSSVMVSKDGRVEGETTLKACQVAGFYGAVWAALYDAQGLILHITKTNRYGLDGSGIDCNTRSVTWHEDTGLNKYALSQVDGVFLYQAHSPRGTWLDPWMLGRLITEHVAN